MPLAEIDQWFLNSAFGAAPSEVPAEDSGIDPATASSARP
jgi:hypothetical protein